MRKLIIIPELLDKLSLNNPFLRIMLELPPEATGFYCGREYSATNPQLLEELNGRGIPIVYDTLDGIGPGSVVVANAAVVWSPNEKLNAIKRLGAQVIFFAPGTEQLYPAPQANEFYLYNSETQMFLCLSGARFSLDAQGSPEVGLLPGGGQGGAVGMLRSEHQLTDSEEDKFVLRARLAEILKKDFHPKLPLALHFLSHNNVQADVDRGLSRLGNKVNVLIKNLDWHGKGFEEFKSEAKGKFVFVFNRYPADNPFEYNRLMRYAADVILPGCFSGLLATSVMMGHRLIPVYTQHMRPTLGTNNRISFSRGMLTQASGGLIDMKILDYLPPICIEASDMLHDRIFDYEYWKKYDQQLPLIQRAVFGRYLLGEAAVQRAKGFIFRLLQFGSFIPPNANAKDLVSVSVPHPLNTENVMPPL